MGLPFTEAAPSNKLLLSVVLRHAFCNDDETTAAGIAITGGKNQELIAKRSIDACIVQGHGLNVLHVIVELLFRDPDLSAVPLDLLHIAGVVFLPDKQQVAHG